MNLKALIIEDEPASQELLALKLERFFPDIELLKIIDNAPDALAFLTNNKVDIVFLDNQIKGGYGIQILEALPSIQFDVIFHTAHADYALQAFKFGAIHYLLKPLITSDFLDAVNRAIAKRSGQPIGKEPEKKFIVNSQQETLALDFDQLYYFQSSGAYTEVNTIDKKYILSKNLGKIETELDSKKFLRVNHNFIVNKDKIESIEKGKNALINLSNRERIPISQRRYQFVLAAFEHKNPAD